MVYGEIQKDITMWVHIEQGGKVRGNVWFHVSDRKVFSVPLSRVPIRSETRFSRENQVRFSIMNTLDGFVFERKRPLPPHHALP